MMSKPKITIENYAEYAYSFHDPNVNIDFEPDRVQIHTKHKLGQYPCKKLRKTCNSNLTPPKKKRK